MSNWEPGPPRSEEIGDHEVPVEQEFLAGKRIALIVTGGIAAYQAPMVARQLRRWGAAGVVPFLTHESQRYVGCEALEWACNQAAVTNLSFQAEHLSHSQPLDAYLVAPATYNLINSLRHGIANTPVLSTLATALGNLQKGQCSVLIAPTMHGQMHTPILQESLHYLLKIGVRLIQPRDLYGKHNLPHPETLAAEVARSLSQSRLKGKRVLITAGSIPTWIDDVRVMTNLFRGTLGIQIAKELHCRGADVKLILGPSTDEPPTYIECVRVRSFEEYRDVVLNSLRDWNPEVSIHSAAVADYKPRVPQKGKIPSQGFHFLELESTEKVVDLARKASPHHKLISFKFQLNMEHAQLMEIAIERLGRGHDLVVANRGEEKGPNGEQIAYLVGSKAVTRQDQAITKPLKMISKPQIARKLAEAIENLFLT